MYQLVRYSEVPLYYVVYPTCHAYYELRTKNENRMSKDEGQTKIDGRRTKSKNQRRKSADKNCTTGPPYVGALLRMRFWNTMEKPWRGHQIDHRHDWFEHTNGAFIARSTRTTTISVMHVLYACAHLSIAALMNVSEFMVYT